MKVLAIGNSFSQDATTFLHQVAEEQGVALEVVNLYIGGCSLETHWKNMETNAVAYEHQFNGKATGRMVSIQEMLNEDDWDAIVTQQASHDSGWLDTYEPFLSLIVSELRRCAPKARLILQETWAYEIDSSHGAFMRYHRNQQEMYDRLRNNYTTMAKKHGLELIPCGDIIQKVRTLPPFHVQTGGHSLCRDGFHMSYGYGRYLLACAWARKLCSIDATDNTYIPISEEHVEPDLLQIIRETVDTVMDLRQCG